MPIYEIACQDCHYSGEVLATTSTDHPTCPQCGKTNTDKMMSAPSSLTGHIPQSLPSPNDVACCGQRPAETSCKGPGSCCGKT